MGATGATVVKKRAAARRTPVPSEDDAVGLRRALLRWYDKHKRNLPWRDTRDPYRIWVSEIMLQQTRVAAVLGHYRAFLERFPNVMALAAATEDAVLAAWSGLGYYGRARRLRACAQQIAVRNKGQFPDNAAALRALPGIGRYTAAAVASMGFGEAVAVVDGNVERVLQRFAGVDLTSAQIWEKAQGLLEPSRPGDFNQAMMELGATACVPREPRCAACPLRKWCVTRQSNVAALLKSKSGSKPLSKPGRTVTSIARARKRPASTSQVRKTIWCTLSGCNGSIRLVRRPRASSLMPGMWELPQTTHRPRPLPQSAPWRTFRHSVTVTDYTVHVVRVTPRRGRNASATAVSYQDGRSRWIALDRIADLPITGLTRKILKAEGVL